MQSSPSTDWPRIKATARRSIWPLCSSTVRRPCTGSRSLRCGILQWSKRLSSSTDVCGRTLLWFEDLRQQVRFGFIAHQVRVALAAVVIELVGFVILGVLDEEFEGRGRVLAGFERVAQDFWRILTAVHCNQPHARANSSQSC